MKANNIPSLIITTLIVAVTVGSCAAHRKLSHLEKEETAAKLELDQVSNIPELKVRVAKRDTLKVKDMDGNEVLLMKAIKDDETGEMVVADVLDAAMVTARFRNIAERKGKVDLAFQIIVPERMQDSKWQLRFYPDMFVLEDSIRLDPVVITGKSYRKSQLRGYQQYEKFVNRIVSDSTQFINLRLLEIFLQRNIPQIFSFKTDTTYVSDEEFLSFYGVSEQDAVRHYTNKSAKKMNERRKSRMKKMYDRFIKVPIVTDGIRLDTVIQAPTGDFIYNYVQTINTRPKMRRVDIILSGEIFEAEEMIYQIPPAEPLTFYISTISTFTEDIEKYLTKVVERRVAANTSAHLDFDVGKSQIRPELGNNMEEINAIKENLARLMENEVYDLDSIVVSATASPEGTFAFNSQLAQARSEAVSRYFNAYMKHYLDSLNLEKGFTVSMDSDVAAEEKKFARISFQPRCIPENWEDLYKLVEEDDTLDFRQKEFVYNLAKIRNADEREAQLRTQSFYEYVKEKYYPALRTVKFNFCLHRRGMVKDTVHTTVLDSVYMRGVKHLKDMDYEEALEDLRPYNDFNTALCYMALNRDQSAMMILSPLDRTPEVNYLRAILYARMGNENAAVESYLMACRQNHSFVHRGNLDPEISELIKIYGLNQLTDEQESVSFDF